MVRIYIYNYILWYIVCIYNILYIYIYIHIGRNGPKIWCNGVTYWFVWTCSVSPLSGYEDPPADLGIDWDKVGVTHPTIEDMELSINRGNLTIKHWGNRSNRKNTWGFDIQCFSQGWGWTWQFSWGTWWFGRVSGLFGHPILRHIVPGALCICW